MIKRFLGFFNNKSNEKVKEEEAEEEYSNTEELAFIFHMSNGMNSLKKTEEYVENIDYQEILSLNMSAIVAFEHAQKITTDQETIEKNKIMATAISLGI